MGMKQYGAAALLSVFIAVASASSVWAVTVNNQSPNPQAADCFGACGVGSSLALGRTVAQTNFADNTGTMFTDFWTFTLSEAVNLTGELFANNTLTNFRLTGLTLFLQTADGTTTFDPPGGFSVTGPPPFNTVLKTPIAYSNLEAGNYRFLITGLVPQSDVQSGPLGIQFGQYQLQAELSAVPLPAGIWLFITALTGLAAVARVRRKRLSAG